MIRRDWELMIRKDAAELYKYLQDTQNPNAKETKFSDMFDSALWSKEKRKNANVPGSIGGNNSPKVIKELIPIVLILQNHIRNERFETSDIDAVRRLLNKRLTKLSPFATGPNPTWYLQENGPMLKFAAEALLKYLRHYAEAQIAFPSKPLKKPFGLCLNCGGILFRQRSSKKTCSQDCRFKNWREENPYGRDYWKPRNRANKKRNRAKS